MYKKFISANATPKESFKYYRLNSKRRKVKNTPRSLQHRKITSAFWDKVGEYMVEKKGGVFVEKFGYFCVSTPLKKYLPMKKGKWGKYLNPHTESRIYFPVLITDVKDHYLKVFTMDRSFASKVRQGISKKLKEGFKYINLYKQIKDTFLHKYTKIKILS